MIKAAITCDSVYTICNLLNARVSEMRATADAWERNGDDSLASDCAALREDARGISDLIDALVAANKRFDDAAVLVVSITAP